MKSGSLVSIVMVTCLVLVSGCAAVKAKSQADKLDRTVTEYASSLRWSFYREAISFHVNRDGKFAEVDIDQLESIAVTDFNIISKTIIPSSEKGGVNEAIIEAEVSYYHKSQGTLREMSLSQIWWYNEEFKAWMIESDFPEFK